MNEAEKQAPRIELDEADIAAYLDAHPDFLRRHPETLEMLQISHDSGTAVSLIERQVVALRATNRQLLTRFNELVDTARDNEQRVVHLNRVAKVLVSAETAAALVDGLAGCVKNHLDIDCVYIGLQAELCEPVEAIDHISDGTPASKALTNVFRRGKPICGPIKPEQSAALFATDDNDPMASAAMIPLGTHGVKGALVLASRNPKRFLPETGTLFLELFGDLVSASLERLLGPDVLA